MLKLSLMRKRKVSTSSDDSDEEQPQKITAVPKNFVVRKRKEVEGLFLLDTQPIELNELDEKNPGDLIIEDVEKVDEKTDEPVDKKLQKLLSKAKCGPAFEKSLGAYNELLSKNAVKRKRKEEKEKTTGRDWFDMPATELTDEARQDLELLQIRNVLDPLSRYKRPDREVLPKYFQVGRVIDAPEDYYSSRMTKKERKKTMVDELLNDMEFVDKSIAKHREIAKEQAKRRRGAFQGGRKGEKMKKRQRKEDKKAIKNKKRR